MDFIRFSITNPVKVAVGVLLVLLFGFIALGTIPVQLTPDVDRPIITITTEWPGRSPEEVENELIEEQEDVLKNISGLDKMTATAYQGRAEIELEFFVGVDTNSVRQEVSDSLREVPEYPDQADEPVIAESEAGAGSPVAWMILTLENADADFNVQALGDPVEDRVKAYLERVTGVSEVRVYGGRVREVHVNVDPSALAQRGVTFDQFYQAIQSENVNVSAGDVKEGRYDTRIRLVGQYEALDPIRNTIITYGPDGGPVTVGDVSEVELGYAKRRSFVRSKGEVALAMPVYRETGSNVIELVAELDERLVHVNEEILPSIAQQTAELYNLSSVPKLEVEKVYDETVYINEAIGLVQTNLVIGGTLAVIALIVFLRIIRPTLVVALAIPISIIGTFVVMAGFGRTVNVISLAGLAFAVGMVVDNAIVVLENIDRHLGMGKAPRQAAYDAAQEVWGAILASTLTTLAVFVPVLTIQEEAGQLFRDIALAICAAVTLSLLTSITVIPTASARFLKSHTEPKTRLVKSARQLFGIAPIAAKLSNAFSNLIYRITSPNLLGVVGRVVIVGFFTIVALGGAYVLMPATDYLPRGNQNLVFGFILTPPGYNIEQDRSIAHRVEDRIQPYWEAESQQQLQSQNLPTVVNPMEQAEVTNIPPIQNYFFVSFFGGVFHGATSQNPSNVEPLAGLMTWAASSIPGAIGFAEQSSIFGRGGGGSRAIDVEVLGLQLDPVLGSAELLRNRLTSEYGQAQVQPTPSNFDKAGRELRVKIDRVRAADLGINVSSLGNGVRALVDGLYVGDYQLRGDTIDMLAMRDPDLPLQPEELGDMPLAYVDRQGQPGQTQLSSVATLTRQQSPQQILRIDEQRAVTLQVTPPDGEPLEQATGEIRRMVDELREAGEIDPGVTVNLAGSASKLESVREAMLGAWYPDSLMQSLRALVTSRLFLALLVTFLLMAALFESFLYPLVIMFSVPLATVGGFIGLAIVHYFIPTQQLDTLTMLGFIILIGVVVNNAILIVHQALNFMRGLGEGEGDQTGRLEARDAIRASVASRIRPVFMTTCTSVAGMLPLVVMPGAGSELYRGLGSVVVGGLVIASVFTLLVVPLLFSLVLDAQRGLYSKMGWQLPESEPQAELSPSHSAAQA